MRVSIFTDELFMDASRAIPVIASWGCKTVDFRGNINGKGIEYQTDDELRVLKSQVEEHGLCVGVLQSSLCKVHLPDAKRIEDELRKLEGIIRAADILGTKLVRSFNFWQPSKDEFGTLVIRPDMFQIAMDMYAPIAKRAKEAGLVLGIENCGQSVQEIAAILDALAVCEWGVAWDVSNHWDQVPGIEDESKQFEYILSCLKRSNMVHVKASSILPELDGVKIDWPRILRGVQALGIEGFTISIETHNPQGSPFSNEEASRLSYEAIIAALPKKSYSSLEEAIATRRVFPRSYENNPVNFIIWGKDTGHSYEDQLANTLGCNLYGVADIAENDPQIFLNDPTVEAVYLLPGTHDELVVRCIQAGKHVLITQPIGRCLKTYADAVAEAEDKGTLFGVDLSQRYNDTWLSLCEAYNNGYFGRVVSASVHLKIGNELSYQGEACNLIKEAMHDIELLVWVLGIPKKVMGYIAAHTGTVENLIMSVWEYENGMLVNILVADNYPSDKSYSRVEIHGTSGAFMAEVGGSSPDSVKWLSGGKWTSVMPYPAEAEYANAADNLASAIRLGANIECPGTDCIKSQTVLDAIYRSAARQGEWINLLGDEYE